MVSYTIFREKPQTASIQLSRVESDTCFFITFKACKEFKRCHVVFKISSWGVINFSQHSIASNVRS